MGNDGIVPPEGGELTPENQDVPPEDGESKEPRPRGTNGHALPPGHEIVNLPGGHGPLSLPTSPEPGPYISARDEFINSPDRPDLKQIAETWGLKHEHVKRVSANEEWHRKRDRVWEMFERKRARRISSQVARLDAKEVARRVQLARLVQARGAEHLAQKDAAGRFVLNPRHFGDAARAVVDGLAAERAERGDAMAMYQRFYSAIADVLDENVMCEKCRTAFFNALDRIRQDAVTEDGGHALPGTN